MIDLETIEREIDELETLTVPFRHVLEFISVGLFLVALKTALYGIKGKSGLSSRFGCRTVSGNLSSVFKLYARLRLLGGSTFVSQPHCSIVDIVLVRTPFKIVSTIVNFAFVLMVDLIQSVWVRTKRRSHKPMHSICPSHAIAVEDYVLVSSFLAKRQAHNLPRLQAFHAS